MSHLPEDKLYYTEYKEIENRKDFAVCRQSVTDEIPLEKCLELFEECRSKGILENESFEDKKWYGYNPTDTIRMSLNFDFFATNDMVLKLKKYVVVKLGLCRVAIGTIYSNLLHIKKMLIFTHMLQAGYEADFASYIKENRDYAKGCRDFLSFLTHENAMSYYKAIEDIKRDEAGPRAIPDYESVILMDLIIRDFMDKCDMKYRVKYYPLFIWWLLSTIIPLRPTEVLELKRDCIYTKNNKYYIHIDRIKNKNNRTRYYAPIMKEFQIPENVYKFLDDYTDYVNDLDEGAYLIPYSLYAKYSPKLKGRKKERINTICFNRLLKKFMREVVEQQYQYVVVPLGKRKEDNQIEQIHMGDTRHLAFLNMMMQGLNPLYIQRIGGHYKLEEQLYYCSHLDTFATAKTYVLSKALKNRITVGNMEMRDWSVEESRKEMLGLSFYSLPQVKNGAGRCTSVNVPNDCVCDECLFCQHFIPEKNVAQDYIKEMQLKNEKNIELKKETLSFLLKDAYKNEKNIDVVSKHLAALINQKLIIDAYTMNLKEEEGEDTT